MLHAWTLSFPQPLTHAPIAVTAPLPADFEAVVKRLKYAGSR